MTFAKTIYYDLLGLKKIILEGQKSSFFSIVPVFSISRDANMIIYEANKILRKENLIKQDVVNIEYITTIRHKLKSNQGIKNRVIFNEVLQKHLDRYGKDIDNLGFYIENNTLVGSTLFPIFVNKDTPMDGYDSKAHLNYNIKIGNTVSTLLQATKQAYDLPSHPLKTVKENEIEYKDIWHKRIFKDDDVTYNVFLTRILLVQNELTTCLWLNSVLDTNYLEISLDKYILLRLSSIKLFETMRNLIDIKGRLESYWELFKLNKLNTILSTYEIQHKDEMKTLRNMLHYSSENMNFYDYLIEKVKKHPEYIEEQLEIILSDYIDPIRNIISDSVNIKSYKSMSDFEKIVRRLKLKS